MDKKERIHTVNIQINDFSQSDFVGRTMTQKYKGITPTGSNLYVDSIDRVKSLPQAFQMLNPKRVNLEGQYLKGSDLTSFLSGATLALQDLKKTHRILSETPVAEVYYYHEENQNVF